MDFSKLKNKMLIVLCAFVVLVPFVLITFTYASEQDTVSFSVENGIYLSSNNVLVSDNNQRLYYLPIEKGYSYTITLNGNLTNFRYAFGNDLTVNSDIYNFTYLGATSDFSITINSNDFDYLYFYANNFDSQADLNLNEYFTITRSNIAVMDSAVHSLVDSVGISNFWNIFDISINYIVVVVLFAFGCYIIFRIIRKISRGKEGL